jgi:hypothetical protein
MSIYMLTSEDVEEFGAKLPQIDSFYFSEFMSDCEVPLVKDRDGILIEIKSITIEECPRCGKKHEEIDIYEFMNDTGSMYTDWAFCPETFEPIMISDVKVLEDVGFTKIFLERMIDTLGNDVRTTEVWKNPVVFANKIARMLFIYSNLPSDQKSGTICYEMKKLMGDIVNSAVIAK